MKTNLLWLLILSLPAFGQTKITGKVIDEKGEGIPGANISIQNSYDGTSSAIDGGFAFEPGEKGNRILVATFVGYKGFQQSVELTGKPIVLTVSLREEINQLEAVTISAGSFTAGDDKRRTILKAIDIATTAGATADIAGALNTPATGLSTPPSELSAPATGLSTPPSRLSTPLQETLPEEFQSAIKNLGKRVNDAETLRSLILKICSIRPFKTTELAEILGKRDDYLKRKFLGELIASKELKYLHPEMLNHPEQAYLTNKKD